MSETTNTVKTSSQQERLNSIIRDAVSAARAVNPKAFADEHSVEVAATSVAAAHAATNKTWKEELVRDLKTAGVTLAVFSGTIAVAGYVASRRARNASGNSTEQINNENPFAAEGLKSSFSPRKAAN